MKRKGWGEKTPTRKQKKGEKEEKGYARLFWAQEKKNLFLEFDV